MERKDFEEAIRHELNSGIVTANAFRDKLLKILVKNRLHDEARKLWDYVWSDDDRIPKFLDKLSDSEYKELKNKLKS